MHILEQFGTKPHSSSSTTNKNRTITQQEQDCAPKNNSNPPDTDVRSSGAMMVARPARISYGNGVEIEWNTKDWGVLPCVAVV